jgi:cell division protein FtsL
MSANSFWVDERLRSQRVTTRPLSPVIPVREISRTVIGSRTEVRRRGGLVPAWVVFGIVIAAAAALCVSVTMRTRGEAAFASVQREKITSEVQQLRQTNAALEQEIRRLSTDSRTIETAARSRLNMVRPNEIVAPAE